MQRARKPDQLFRADIDGIAHAACLCIDFPLAMRITRGASEAPGLRRAPESAK
jgi:hypothetical protein